MFKLTLNRSDIMIFLFSLAVIHGASFALMDNYRFEDCIDCQTYVGLSRGDFDQSPIRRYRIIVPCIAGVIHRIADPLFETVKPWSFNYDFSLYFSFLIVNNIIMALFGLIVYKLCRIYVKTSFAAIIGLLTLLTCRWTAYIAGLPLVDSLYCLIIGMTLLGIKTGNRKLLIAAIFIGPWAKESFIFIAPVIFLYSPINKFRQLVLFFLSGTLVFGFRFMFDHLNGYDLMESLRLGTGHITNIRTSLNKLFSFHGLYELFSVTGFWILLVFTAFSKRKFFSSLILKMERFWLWYLLAVMVHILLSADIARMFYLLTPALALFSALVVDNHSGLQRLLAILPEKDVR
ncbi:MAG TPA: hypothetical protein VMW76_10780 [Bacteroidales bacterium]|nr:hypothetical protein [Bacteroidales bacterium]